MQLKVKSLTILIFFILGCNSNQIQDSENNDPTDLRAEVLEMVGSINELSKNFIDEPSNKKDYQTNDSLSRQIGVVTEKIVNKLFTAYGKTPTDTILSVLNFLDNSGFIPDQLLERLTEEDFTTEIGKKAKLAYEAYMAETNDKEGYLKEINLCFDGLLIYDIANKDTIKLCDLLDEVHGYKILDFWSAWCAPCRVFNRSFQDSYAKIKNQGVELIGFGAQINDLETHYVAVNRDNTPWGQYIDIEDNIYSMFNTRVMPFQILLDKENNIVKLLSFDVENDLEEIMKSEE